MMVRFLRSRISPMKAIIRQVDEEELARRKLTGIDRYDEMWEGVLREPGL